MNLKRILSPELISTSLQGETKREIIEEMVDILVKAGRVSRREAVLECVLERESKMSTGMQFGLAIPHGKTDAVDEMSACVGIKGEGIDFESLDGDPSRIFIMTISPAHKTGPHVQFLAEISKLLNSEERREALIAAPSPAAAYDMFRS